VKFSSQLVSKLIFCSTFYSSKNPENNISQLPQIIKGVHFLKKVRREVLKEIKVFDENIPGFSPYTSLGTKRFKVQMRVSVQLQRALNDTRR